MLGGARRRLRRLIQRPLFPYGKPWARREEWSIGIYTGPSPLHFTTPRGVRNPILSPSDVTDVPAAIVADPFMVRMGHVWHMFFEVLNAQTGKGEIGLATSRTGHSWTYRQIVLAEPFHLSYPYVFEHQKAIYMIPESYQANSVRLYRARRFPTDWSFVCTLLEGGYFADSSVVWHQGMWWMFTETGQDFKFDTLRLFYADDLAGPWREHLQSPVIAGDAHIARPAGRPIALNGRLIRYAQDDYPTYGRQVWAFEIVELTTRRYREQPASPHPILEPGRRAWNCLGMHHVDPHEMDDGSWLACVDGYGVERPLVARLRRRIQRLLRDDSPTPAAMEPDRCIMASRMDRAAVQSPLEWSW